MKLLVINPNTNPAVTEQVRATALAYAGAGTRIEAVNPARGPFSIETDEHKAQATVHVTDLVRNGGQVGYDGYVVACFDDIGVAEARRIVDRPVISLAEAAIRAAARKYRRFAVVTTVPAAVPTIEQLAQSYGLAGSCGVLAVDVGVAEAASRSARAEQRLVEAVRLAYDRDGAQAIVLGSGAYSGRAADLSAAMGIPFLESLEEAIRYCENA
ncbi:aspartate/glutamate racemase family protein [Castellaniella hirudinis]|uniref:Aspartate/glutamate racemase family protein n=1 Tax=Castellaniella hirudinis TaxID=1144617 RepID=A0ABV8S2M2_9BURK